MKRGNGMLISSSLLFIMRAVRPAGPNALPRRIFSKKLIFCPTVALETRPWF